MTTIVVVSGDGCYGDGCYGDGDCGNDADGGGSYI